MQRYDIRVYVTNPIMMIVFAQFCSILELDYGVARNLEEIQSGTMQTPTNTLHPHAWHHSSTCLSFFLPQGGKETHSIDWLLLHCVRLKANYLIIDARRMLRALSLENNGFFILLSGRSQDLTAWGHAVVRDSLDTTVSLPADLALHIVMLARNT